MRGVSQNSNTGFMILFVHSGMKYANQKTLNRQLTASDKDRHPCVWWMLTDQWWWLVAQQATSERRASQASKKTMRTKEEQGILSYKKVESTLPESYPPSS